MRAEVALFPLRLVLLPGSTLPLHVFEPRYRELMRSLLAHPEPDSRHFGIVLIRRGAEVGDHPTVEEVGCLAVLREATELEDGRFDVVVAGGARFRITGLDDSQPLLRAEIEVLPESSEAQTTAERAALMSAAALVRSRFDSYLRVLAHARGGGSFDLPALPDDPVVLSYALSALALLDLDDRQALLAAPDATARLRLLGRLLRREAAVVAATGSIPAADFARAEPTPN